jgi:hypothetical protein
MFFPLKQGINQLYLTFLLMLLKPYNKMNYFGYFKFITEIQDTIVKYRNITTKLKWKILTKVIKRPSEEAWVC